jgi:salicylate hydroxylase
MPHIAVAGAGIGGLTAALSLSQIGATVTVYEQAEALGEVGAGVQLSPNATAVLARLDLLDALRQCAVEPNETLLRRGRDGATLARIPLGAVAARRYGSPSLVVLRADLQARLMARVDRDPAISLRLDQGLSSYRHIEGGVGLVFDDARHPVATADGLVGADGIRSTVRQRMIGPGPDDIRPSGRSAWRSLVARDAADPDALVPRSNLWLGAGAHLVHYPVGGGKLVNVVAVIDESVAAGRDAFWSMPADAAVLERRFATWAEAARRLIAAAPGWRKWPLFDRPPLQRWSDGAVTLLGDAAHPMLPFLAQGAAQAIEDAAVLADCVAAAPRALSAAFHAYEVLRRPRTARVQVESRRQAAVYHLGAPASLLRDMLLRSLGPDRLAARYDWIYAGPAPTSRA